MWDAQSSSCSLSPLFYPEVISEAEPLLRLLNQQEELQKIVLEILKMHFSGFFFFFSPPFAIKSYMELGNKFFSIQEPCWLRKRYLLCKVNKEAILSKDSLYEKSFTGRGKYWIISVSYTWGFPSGSVVKNRPASEGDVKRRGFDQRVGKIPWRRGQGNPLLTL